MAGPHLGRQITATRCSPPLRACGSGRGVWRSGTSRLATGQLRRRAPVNERPAVMSPTTRCFPTDLGSGGAFVSLTDGPASVRPATVGIDWAKDVRGHG